MVTTTDTDNLNPRLVLLVNPATDTGVALIERDSIEYEFNEENEDFEPGSSTRVKVDPTTEEPKVTFDAARGVDDDALEELGVVDADGKYQRGADREWEEAELWFFDTDGDAADAADAGDPDTVDRFEEVRWDIDSGGPDGNTLMFSAEAHVDGDIYLGYEMEE